MAAKRVRDRGWLAKEMADLERMRLDGLSIAAIATQLGRSFHSVKGRIQLLGVKFPGAKAIWFDVLSRGLPEEMSARLMGVTLGTVRTRRSRLRKLGFDFADGRRRAS